MSSNRGIPRLTSTIVLPFLVPTVKTSEVQQAGMKYTCFSEHLFIYFSNTNAPCAVRENDSGKQGRQRRFPKLSLSTKCYISQSVLIRLSHSVIYPQTHITGSQSACVSLHKVTRLFGHLHLQQCFSRVSDNSILVLCRTSPISQFSNFIPEYYNNIERT